MSFSAPLQRFNNSTFFRHSHWPSSIFHPPLAPRTRPWPLIRCSKFNVHCSMFIKVPATPCGAICHPPLALAPHDFTRETGHQIITRPGSGRSTRKFFFFAGVARTFRPIRSPGVFNLIFRHSLFSILNPRWQRPNPQQSDTFRRTSV